MTGGGSRPWSILDDPAGGSDGRWSCTLARPELRWVHEHRVAGEAVVAAAVYLELAVAVWRASGSWAGGEPLDLLLDCERPAEAAVDRTLMVSLVDEGARETVEIGPREGGPPFARLRRIHPPVGTRPSWQWRDLDGPRDQDAVAGEELYTARAAAGTTFGPGHRVVDRLWRRDREAMATVVAGLAPPLTATVDGAFQVLGSSAGLDAPTFVVAGCEHVRIRHEPNERATVVTRRDSDTGSDVVGDADILDEGCTGVPAVELRGIRLHRLGPGHAVRVGVAASFTADPLADAARYWLDVAGRAAEIRMAPAHQLLAQLADPDSALAAADADLTVVLTRAEDWVGVERGPRLNQVAGLNDDETRHLRDDIWTHGAYLRHGIALADGDTVIDVGANIGMFSMFARHGRPRCRLVAVEPHRAAFAKLEQNLDRDDPLVTLVPAGVAAEPGVERFTAYTRSSVFSGFDANPDRDRSVITTVLRNSVSGELPPAETERVVADLMVGRLEHETYDCPTTTISEMITTLGLERVDLLKVDTEGREGDVLAGIRDEHWARIRQLVLEVHDGRGTAVDAIVAVLTDRGYEVTSEPADGALRGTGFSSVYARRPDPPRVDAPPTAGTGEMTPATVLGDAVEGFAHRAGGPVVVVVGASRSPDRQVVRFADTLAARLAGVPDVAVVLPDDVARTLPVTPIHDAAADRIAGLPYTDRYFAALGTAAVRAALGLHQRPPKAIVVDADDTLWSGRCGEDGPDTVVVDEGRRWFQNFLIEQRDAGAELCLASRNHPADVLRVFDRHTDMPLRWSDFAAGRIGPDPKSASVASLAAELGYRTADLAFLDDDPVEVAEVLSVHPDVLAVRIPADPAAVPTFVANLWALDRSTVTEADRARADRRRTEQRRQAARAAAPSLAQFLRELDVRVEAAPLTHDDVARAAQITARTTQFTTTSRTYSPADLWARVDDPDRPALTFRASDTYGDHGMVGLLLGRVDGTELTVESLNLSCRAFGRGVEHAMVGAAGRLATGRGLTGVAFPFVPTARNSATAAFLDSIAPTEPGVVARLDALSAAAVRFSPPEQPAATVAPSTADTAPSGPSGPDRSPLPTLTRRATVEIAHRLTDPDAAVAAIVRRRRRDHGTASSGPAAPPVGRLEGELVALWEHLLGIDTVGVTDNFFDLGGTSLLAARLAATLPSGPALQPSVLTVFRYPTIRSLAAAALGADTGTGAARASAEERGRDRRRRRGTGRNPRRTP